jgi:hypothetical protein
MNQTFQISSVDTLRAKSCFIWLFNLMPFKHHPTAHYLFFLTIVQQGLSAFLFGTREI